MTPADPSSPRLSRALLRAGVVAAASLALVALAPAARAETGGPPPQAGSGDVAAPQQPPQGQADAAAQGDGADDYADTDPSALSDFRAPLAPYGQWVQDPTYGTIWVPDPSEVGSDFAPYQTAGQWTVDDDGDWMWQSDYAWGYIPFHYGRWVWAGRYWGWIPGRRYAPAWVTWRVGEMGYVGWAPLPPTWYWADGVAVGLYTVPYAAYCFVPTNYAFYRGVSNYVVRDRGMIGAIARGTHPYRPATPTIASHVRRGHLSPTLSEAHIPASASPATRVSADARAVAYATRSSTASLRAGYGPGSSYARPGVHPGRSSAYEGRSSAYEGRSQAWRGSYAYPHTYRGSASQGLRTPGYGYGYPSYRSPAMHAGAYPSYPSYHAVPHYSAPASSYHPSYMPSFSHAAPARSFGGGMRSFGGGGRHR